LLDFNLALLPKVFFFLLLGTLDFVALVEMLGFVAFTTSSISQDFSCLETAVLTFSIDHAIQNELDASNPASQRETPISRRHLSLRFNNSWRERTRLRHSAK
jgi:hypothetical protein